MLYWLPDSIDGGLVGVGDQLQCGVGSGQWEHTGVQGLLGERIVGWIKFTWHHVHRHRGLEGTGQGELAGPEGAPTSQVSHPTSLCPPNSVTDWGLHTVPAPKAAHTQLQEDLIQHLDCLHTGCLGFLGEILGLGVETQETLRP